MGQFDGWCFGLWNLFIRIHTFTGLIESDYISKMGKAKFAFNCLAFEKRENSLYT